MPLAEELVDFLILFLGSCGDDFYSIDSVGQPDQDPCIEVMDDGGGMGGVIQLGFDDPYFEFHHVLRQVFVISADSSIGEPHGGFCSRV